MPFYCANQWGFTRLALPPNIPAGYCNVPTGLSVSNVGAATTFNWTAPHDVLYYLLEYQADGDAGWQSAIVYGQNYVTSLDPVTLYHWRVTSVCSIINQSVPASGPDFTTNLFDPNCIAPVSGNILVTFSAIGVKISWSGITAILYNTELRMKGTQIVIKRQVSIPEVTYVSLKPNTVYEIRIKSLCQGTESEWSDWFEFNSGNFAACPQVKSVSVVTGISAVSVSWIRSSEVRSVNVLLNDILYIAGVTISTVNISGLNPATDYNIKLVSVCDDGPGFPVDLDVTTKATECVAPTDLELSVVDNEITATWTPASGIVSQEIILNNGNAVVLGSGINTYAYTVPSTGVVHVIAVRSLCATSVSIFVDKSILVPFYCSAPTGLYLSGANNNSASVGWDAVQGALSYQAKIYRNSDDALIATNNVTNTFTQFTGLDTNTEYYVKVVTVCENGNSSDSDELDFSTTINPSCPAPAITQIIKVGSNYVTFRFVIVNGETSGDYTIEVRDASNNLVYTANVTSTTEEYTATGLVPGEIHSLKVINNGTNCTATNDIEQFLTPTTCPPPISPSGTFTNAGLLTVTFGEPGGISFYRLEVVDMDGRVYSAISDHSPILLYTIEKEYASMKVASFCDDFPSEYVDVDIACPQPRDFIAELIGGQIIVSWGGGDGRFVVTVIPSMAATYDIETTKPTVTIGNLIPSTAYEVYARRICADGVSAATATLKIVVPGNGGRVIPPEEEDEFVNEDPIIFEVVERAADPVMIPCVPIPDCPDGFQPPDPGCTGTNDCGCGCNGTPGTGKPYIAGRNIFIEDKGTHFVIHNIAAEVGLLEYTHGLAEAPTTTISMPGIANKSILAVFNYPQTMWHITTGTPTSSQVQVDRENEVLNFGTEVMPGQHIGIIIRGLIASEDGGGGSGELPADIADRLVFGEVPSGDTNGSNPTFTTAFEFVPGTEAVRLNGVDQALGTDYTTLAGTTIVFVVSPEAEDTIEVDYVKAI